MLWREFADAQEDGALGRQQSEAKVEEDSPKQRKMLQRGVHYWAFYFVMFFFLLLRSSIILMNRHIDRRFQPVNTGGKKIEIHYFSLLFLFLL